MYGSGVNTHVTRILNWVVRELVNVHNGSQVLRPVKWNPRPLDAWFSSEKYSIGGAQTAALALAANDSAIATLGAQVGARAADMCAANAFLHWYSKFGIEQVRVQHTVYLYSRTYQQQSNSCPLTISNQYYLFNLFA